MHTPNTTLREIDKQTVPLLTPIMKVKKTIAKLEERLVKLDTERAKILGELADSKRLETIETGEKEFLKAVGALDLSTREMLVTTVLGSLKDEARLARIQAWIAIIHLPTFGVEEAHPSNRAIVDSDLEEPRKATRTSTQDSDQQRRITQP